ncbi:MAG: hypothetical protein WCR96_07815, partial [Candidatus Methanomethylophilaceae archaeon]
DIDCRIMAKKKRRVEKVTEEEYEFTPPEFDEKEFILKDIYGSKVLFAVTILAIVIGILASCIEKVWSWYGGLLLIIVVIVGMKSFLKILKFDVSLLEQKSMLGNYVLFFLLSLGMWILFINPPFV